MQNYVVKRHDTLWKIGRKFGVSVDEIARANGLRGRRIHLLKIGQNLRIPGETNGSPDTVLALKFRGLDHRSFTPKKIKVEHDSEVKELAPDASGIVSLSIFDHAKGLKVWIEDLTSQFIQVLDKPILPVGNWRVSLDSRKVATKGNLLPTKGPASTTTPALRASTAHNAQLGDGVTVATQARTEQGNPVHGLATIYVEENLRLLPGNERYRKHIIAAAKKYGLTPQSLAALIDAEAAKVDGVWQEKSNSTKPKLAQGLAQFFAPAWTDVANYKGSLLHQECSGLGEQARLAKRLEARYAIDSAATYAHLNLRTFARITKFDVNALPPEDKAKLAYILHHEGVEGALRLVGKAKKPWTIARAEALLAQQFGNGQAKAATFIEQHSGVPSRPTRPGYTVIPMPRSTSTIFSSRTSWRLRSRRAPVPTSWRASVATPQQ